MKSLAVLALATLLLALFFQCCPTWSSELAPVQGPTEQAATPPSESPPPPAEPTPTPLPSEPPPAEPTATLPPPSPTAAPEPTVPTYSEPVVLTEVEGTGSTVTDNFEWPACQKAVFYYTVYPSSSGFASLIVYVSKVGEEAKWLLVNETAESSDVVSGSAHQPLIGGEYYFSTELTQEPWTIRLECQDGVAPVGPGMDLHGAGNIVTDNYELPACQKSVFVWSAEPDDWGNAALALSLCGDECTLLVNEFQTDLAAPMEREALQALRGGVYYLVVANSSGRPWSVRWECRD